MRIPVCVSPAVRRWCVHEAAHTTSALHLGLCVARVGFRFPFWGECTLLPATEDHVSVEAAFDASAISLLAAGIAERRAFGDAQLDGADQTDVRQLLMHGLGVHHDSAQLAEELRRLERRAGEVVTATWPWTVIVARHLSRRGSLTGAAALALRPPTSTVTPVEGFDGLLHT